MSEAQAPLQRPDAAALRAVHMPFELGNPYQRRLLEELRLLEVATIEDRLRTDLARRALREWKADIVHLHWISAWHFGHTLGGFLRRERFFLELRALRRHRVRIVWTIHNLGHHEGTHEAAERAFLRRMVSASHACVVHSQSALEAVLEALGSARAQLAPKLHIIPHGNYDGCYPPARPRGESRRALGIGDQTFVPAFLGLIRPYKNAVGLIRSFRDAAMPDARLLVCGKPQSEALAAELSEAARGAPDVLARLDYLSDQDCADTLAAADAIVLPYLEALTSGAALLAMTFGRPIIAPRRGCFGELVGDDAGILYDPDAPNGLRDALRQAAGDPDRLAAMGRAARTKADALAWSGIAAMYRRLYDQTAP